MLAKRYLILLAGFLFVAIALCGCSKEKSRSADKAAPTVPDGVAITAVSSSEINVSWKPAADDSGKIKGYKIYRNGQYYRTLETTSASDTGLSPKVKFCYRISAFDEAENESAQSAEVCAIL